MKNIHIHWRWLIPLLLFSNDACAWGLYTHVYFAQLLLWAVMFSGGGAIGNTKTTGTISLIKDLSAAVADFKSRYHYLPGDLPKAADDIPGIDPGCHFEITISGIGNGLIDDSEKNCVAKELVLAGFIKGSPSGIISPWNAGASPDVYVIAAKDSQVNKESASPFPSTVQNAIELNSIPCNAVLTIDSKMDDGDTTQGNMRSYPPCVDAGSGIPATTTLDVAL